jgi:hypothetical protein
VLVETTDKSLIGNLTRLAVDVLAVAVNVLNRLNKRFIVAVDVVDVDNDLR